MKKIVAMILCVLMVLSFAACSSDAKEPSSSAASNSGSSAASGDNATADGEVNVVGNPIEAATVEFWYTNELHKPIFEFGIEEYNKAHPDAPIEVNMTLSANADMHQKLLIACQSGTGAPDFADINQNYFTNFVYGEVYFAELNDLVDEVIDDCVASRFDLWSVDGTRYGIPTHVGFMFNYYNMDIYEAAGYTIDDIDAIKTWDDFYALGAQIKEKTGKPQICFETTNQRPFWPMIVSHGSDYTAPTEA